jgi:hypothetical protein
VFLDWIPKGKFDHEKVLSFDRFGSYGGFGRGNGWSREFEWHHVRESALRLHRLLFGWYLLLRNGSLLLRHMRL